MSNNNTQMYIHKKIKPNETHNVAYCRYFTTVVDALFCMQYLNLVQNEFAAIPEPNFKIKSCAEKKTIYDFFTLSKKNVIPNQLLSTSYVVQNSFQKNSILV